MNFFWEVKNSDLNLNLGDQENREKLEIDENSEKNQEKKRGEEEKEDGEKEEEEHEDEDEDDEEQEAFPDTRFEMKAISKLEQVLTLKESKIENQNVSENGPNSEKIDLNKKNVANENQTGKPINSKKPDGSAKNVPLKRGQKAKLNKMKTKYKDQDDEDREIVRAYLAPDGASKKKIAEEKKKPAQQQKQQQQAKKKPLIINKQPNVQPEDAAQLVPNEASNENPINSAAAGDVDADEETVGQNLEDEIAVGQFKIRALFIL